MVGTHEIEEMIESASKASNFLKALANPNRMMILCQLVDGEKSVSELEKLLKLRQPSMSQQLARLRADNLVATRRNGKAVYYRLASEEVEQVLELLYALFCSGVTGGGKPGTKTGARAADRDHVPTL